MWGDPERAGNLEGNDPLVTLLFQISSPAHIPWGDQRWQELLHGYDVWVHLSVDMDHHDKNKNKNNSNSSSSNNNNNNTCALLTQACQSMTKHAGVSSNLAALCLHVTRMLRVLVKDILPTTMNTPANTIRTNTTSTSSSTTTNFTAASVSSATADFSKRVSRVGKARATAGALQLLRIFCHHVIVDACSVSTNNINNNNNNNNNNDGKHRLEEAFLYHTRGDLPCDQPTVIPLLRSILDLICVAGMDNNDSIQTPEVYDAVVSSFHLLFVLLGTQLYQPFQSSFSSNNQNNQYIFFCFKEIFQQQQQQHQQQQKKDNDNLRNFFASSRSSLSVGSWTSQSSTNINKWSPQSLLETCMQWQMKRPPAPERSLAHSYFHLATMAVSSSGQTTTPISPDGMYESHFIVQAAVPKPDPIHGTSSTSTNNASNTNNSRNATNSIVNDESHENANTTSNPQHQNHRQIHLTRRSNTTGNVILDATKGVLVLSSSIILLPFRLMNLVLGALTYKSKDKTSPVGRRYKPPNGSNSRTQDVLWLSESPLADLSSCLVLLLLNNFRATNAKINNPFREQVKFLQDNRWQYTATTTTTAAATNVLSTKNNNVSTANTNNNYFNGNHGTVNDTGLPDLPNRILDASSRSAKSQSSFSIGDLITEEDSSFGQQQQQNDHDELHPLLLSSGSNHTNRSHKKNGLSSSSLQSPPALTLNFESLFEVFGQTLHTEVGALMLYTLLQSSPVFAESLAVRSDLDTLVLPLLRTLYFASKSNSYTDFVSSSSSSKPSNKDGKTPVFDIRSCPFRSLSQLYVIIILLLLFSQDTSFGRDAFRRITVPNVLWYQERNLKNINLGSVLLLTLLRSLLSNLYRIHDAFLLNNCCAVLMNLAPSIVDLHEYAAMRLASVTVIVLKRHAKLSLASSSSSSSPTSSSSSAAATANTNVEEDEEFLSSPLGMYGEVARTLLSLIKHCLSARNIDRNLHLVYALVYHQADLLKLLSKNKYLYSTKESERIQSVTQQAASIIQQEGARTAIKALNSLEENIDILHKAAMVGVKKKKEALDDFTFTYEEEVDPEVFFVPYVWETIVCAVTSSSIEWKKDAIKAFPLLDPVEDALVSNPCTTDETSSLNLGDFSKDGDDLV